MRTVIAGGDVVAPGGMVAADILVEDGRIAGLVERGTGIGDATIDATGLVVLPGAIDAHTHFIQDDPEFGPPTPDEIEGFANGGRGAAAGGVTTVVEMPQATPPTLDGKTFRRRVELAGKDAIVDFALWGGVCDGQDPAAIDDQIAAGAVGFKAFMCESDPTFPGVRDNQILLTLEQLRDTPYMFGLHAENDALLQAGLAREAGRGDALAHADSRPPIVEIEAVNRAIFFAEQTGGWVHIVHLSAGGAADLVKQAKARGVKVTAETCPQYLALDRDDLARLGPYAKCAPAIRDREDVDALWGFLSDGTIDCITSDHCGFTKASKDAGRDRIWDAPNGLPGIQTLLPVFASEARKRGFSWERIAELTATAPARLWRLDDRKGAIRLGADADLVLFDPNGSWRVNAADLLHTQKWSPFEGVDLQGQIMRTILRGATVFENGAVPVEPGFGRFLAARPSA